MQSTKTRAAADCGSDHELVIAKFRLKLKKVGKTTRPFMYDLNQISYISCTGRGDLSPPASPGKPSVFPTFNLSLNLAIRSS